MNTLVDDKVLEPSSPSNRQTYDSEKKAYSQERAYLGQLEKNSDKSHRNVNFHRLGLKFICIASYFLFAIFYYTTYEVTCKDRSLNHLGTNSCDTRLWNYLEAVYFAVVTMCTIGYSDYYPTSKNTKIATIFFIIFGFFTLLSLFADLLRATIIRAELKTEAFHRQLVKRLRNVMKSDEMVTKMKLSVIYLWTMDDLWEFLGWFFSLSLTIVVGAGFFSWNEDWLFIDSFYFALAAITSVGYGGANVYPIRDSSLVFLCVYIPFGFTILVYLLSVCAYAVIVNLLTEVKIWSTHKLLDKKSLRAYYEQDDLQVGKHEFCLAMLMSMGAITGDDVDLWLTKFEQTDVQKKGFITSKAATDVALLSHTNRGIFRECEILSHSQYLLESNPLYQITKRVFVKPQNPHTNLNIGSDQNLPYVGSKRNMFSDKITDVNRNMSQFDATYDGRTDVMKKPKLMLDTKASLKAMELHDFEENDFADLKMEESKMELKTPDRPERGLEVMNEPTVSANFATPSVSAAANKKKYVQSDREAAMLKRTVNVLGPVVVAGPSLSQLTQASPTKRHRLKTPTGKGDGSPASPQDRRNRSPFIKRVFLRASPYKSPNAAKNVSPIKIDIAPEPTVAVAEAAATPATQYTRLVAAVAGPSINDLLDPKAMSKRRRKRRERGLFAASGGSVAPSVADEDEIMGESSNGWDLRHRGGGELVRVDE